MKIKDSPIGIGIFYFVITVAVIGLAVLIDRQINTPEKATQYLTEKGYKSIEIGGIYIWCPKGSPIRRKFTAIDPKGDKVEGKVCAGNWIVDDTVEVEVEATDQKRE